MYNLKRTIIFANGELKDYEAVRALVHSDDLIIAADGGARHCSMLGLIPQVLIGDFDSLDEDEVERIARSGTQIIRHPAHKDYTDLELAMMHAQESGAREVLIFGALGARWDQTLANLLLPASDSYRKMDIRLVDGKQEIYLLRAGVRHVISGEAGDTLSLIPLIGTAQGVKTDGLEYPLHDESLYFGATRGLSNTLLGGSASVQFEQGALLCVVIHKPGSV